ncbi:MAG: metallophosphoesterase, partial [Euzebyales bacterium]|nr:metallophosphoesterase [Euzebyales bacterium]
LGAAVAGRVGVAVLGAHDYWGPSLRNPLHYLVARDERRYGRRLQTARLLSGLQAAGYVLVDNRRQTLETPAGPVDVAGLGDPHVAYQRPEAVDWSPAKGDVALRLGLVHAPYVEVLETFDRHGFDLVLSGHTHGGQLRVPGLGALTNNTDLPLRQSRGLSRFRADLWLHVSAGLGHSIFAPIRFACRPEATLLDLVPAATGCRPL